jgi:hypothetical protein
LDFTFLLFIKFKNIFSNNKVTALSKSVKPGKGKKTYFLRRVITWSKTVRFLFYFHFLESESGGKWVMGGGAVEEGRGS